MAGAVMERGAITQWPRDIFSNLPPQRLRLKGWAGGRFRSNLETFRCFSCEITKKKQIARKRKLIRRHFTLKFVIFHLGLSLHNIKNIVMTNLDVNRLEGLSLGTTFWSKWKYLCVPEVWAFEFYQPFFDRWASTASIPQKMTSIGHFGASDDQNIRTKKFFEEIGL